MILENYLTGFKRYALHEKEMNMKMVKEVISSVKRLDKFTKASLLTALNTENIRNYLYTQKELRIWAPRTFRNQRLYLKIFFNYCVSHHYLKKNPIDAIARPKLPQTLPRFLTSKQVNKLLIELEFCEWRYELERYRNKTIIYTFLFTGMRLNELVNLQISDVNMIDREIIVRKGKGKKQRMIPIHSNLFSILEQYFKYIRGRKERSIWLFHNILNTSQIKCRSVQLLCEKLSKKVGFRYSPHWLRHTFGRNCTNAEISAFKIKELMGHSDIGTTQIYQSVAKKSLKDTFCNATLLG